MGHELHRCTVTARRGLETTPLIFDFFRVLE
jgi:hypothetical protein